MFAKPNWGIGSGVLGIQARMRGFDPLVGFSPEAHFSAEQRAIEYANTSVERGRIIVSYKNPRHIPEGQGRNRAAEVDA